MEAFDAKVPTALDNRSIRLRMSETCETRKARRKRVLSTPPCISGGASINVFRWCHGHLLQVITTVAEDIKCKDMGEYKNPVPTVDVIIEFDGGVVLIRRKNPPPGWAIPGGFVDWGESLEEAAIREAREETGLTVRLVRQMHTYSDPDRDPRGHTITTVYVGEGSGELKAADDALEAGVFGPDDLPEDVAFDHREILEDYFLRRH